MKRNAIWGQSADHSRFAGYRVVPARDASLLNDHLCAIEYFFFSQLKRNL
jgi:hypothetical protein